MTNKENNSLQLPSGWVLTTIGEVSYPIKGKKPKNLGNKTEINKVPYVNIKAFEKKIITQYTDGANCPLCKASDILVVWDGARCGLVGSGSEGAIGSTLAKLVFDEIDDKYFFHFLKSKFEYINKKPRGVGIPHVNPNLFWAIQFPLAPLQEQKRISIKLEELFSFLDAGIESLRKVIVQLKRYRQAVLKYAFEGKLTIEWRYDHNAQIESDNKNASGLVESKKSMIEKLTRKEVDQNSRDLPTDNKRFNLPKGWVWTPFEKVCKEITVGYVGTMVREYAQHGIPFLRSLNVKANCFEPENLKYISTKFHEKLTKSRLTPGDIVVVRSGYVGISCVIPSTLLEANCSDLVIVRPAEYLISEYGSLFLNSNYAKNRINNVKVGIAQSHFNVGAMKKILIPLAPLDEQEQIVTKVLALLSASEELEKNVNKSIKMADLLKKAILANAFSGILVPQNLENEPAQKLLERIRAEHFRNKSKSDPQLELSQYVK